MISNNFAIFIISHGRPNNIKTIKFLENKKYSGKFYIIIDDLDSSKDQYYKNFSEKVIEFKKIEIAKKTDQGDNFNNLRTTTHARNACFEIAEKLGLENFLVLDDDYTDIRFRFNRRMDFDNIKIEKIDNLINSMIKMLNTSEKILSIAFAQGGEFLGGDNNHFAQKIELKRKCMNTFFCSTKKKFKFVSRLNEDVNTYITLGAKGHIFYTTNLVFIMQSQTQTSKGGMTEAYLDSGTYVKSFYSVMYQPSSVKCVILPSKFKRIHHRVIWKNTVPCLISEVYKKK